MSRAIGRPEAGATSRPTKGNGNHQTVRVEMIPKDDREGEASKGQKVTRGIFYTQLNTHLSSIAHHLSRMLEKEGHVTLYILPSAPSDGFDAFAVFSNRHAAVAAGLGQIGWNALVLTPQVGARLRLVSLITEAELRPDPLY